jgi:hypothetical protein
MRRHDESLGAVMSTKKEKANGALARGEWLLIGALVCASFIALPVEGQSDFAIPPGTILPVRLNATLSSSRSKPGQIVTARIMQDVPLPAGAKIREGSKVLGHIVEVSAAKSGTHARISLQFDSVVAAHRTIPVTTNLRAIAGFVEVLEAQTPTVGPGESDVFRWLTTVQVGGDVVYGDGGPVTSGRDASHVVGKSVGGGVLGEVIAKEGTKCRGAINGNESPQALWVFSADACGVYGIAHVEIAHAGRSEPVGVIVLSSDTNSVKIAGGAGLLLRVDEAGK